MNAGNVADCRSKLVRRRSAYIGGSLGAGRISKSVAHAFASVMNHAHQSKRNQLMIRRRRSLTAHAPQDTILLRML